MHPKQRKVTAVLRKSQHLSQLIKRADSVSQQSNTFAESLPEDLRRGVQFAGYDNGTVTLNVASAMIATQVRLRQLEILTSLRTLKEFQYAYQVKLKVRPTYPKQAERKVARHISPQTAALLHEEAELCDDPELRRTFQSIASLESK